MLSWLLSLVSLFCIAVVVTVVIIVIRTTLVLDVILIMVVQPSVQAMRHDTGTAEVVSTMPQATDIISLGVGVSLFVRLFVC